MVEEEKKKKKNTQDFLVIDRREGDGLNVCVYTYGYTAIVASRVKMSRLGAAAVLQVKDCGGGILCLRQNSRGLQAYSCRTSGRSDLAAIIIHGILLSMKYC